jgi:hypothetical protein
MLEFKETYFVFDVSRVVYGRVPGRTLHVRGFPGRDLARANLARTLGREPTEPEMADEVRKLAGFEPGRNVLIFLNSVETPARPGDPVVCISGGTCFDVPPRFPLDAFEKEIVEVVRTGAYLTPESETAGSLGSFIRSSDRIVRAKLAKAGETTSDWTVSSVVYAGITRGRGEGAWTKPLEPLQLEAETARVQGSTVTVGLDPWRLRAESVATYETAVKREGPPGEEAIRKQFDQLLGSELAAGTEAILFLRTAETPKAEAAFGLVGILRADPVQPDRLDSFEKAIRRTVESGEFNNIYL